MKGVRSCQVRERKPLGWWRPDQRGAIIVITAFCILVFLGLLGMAVDLGYLYVMKVELQKAADAGAMAGAEGLFYPADTSWPQCAQALAQAQAITRANLVDSAVPTVSPQTGRWDWNASAFTANCSANAATFTNAVRVTASRINIPLFFMGALGLGPITQLSATATGVNLLGSWPPGMMPVAVNKKAVDETGGAGHTLRIRFSNDSQDNGGWFAPSPYGTGASQLKNFINQTPPMPVVNMSSAINLGNGSATAVLSALASQLAAHGNRWEVSIPLVNAEGVSNYKFNHSDTIDGFMCFEMTKVVTSGNPKYIEGTIKNFSVSPSISPGEANFHPIRLVK